MGGLKTHFGKPSRLQLLLQPLPPEAVMFDAARVLVK